MIAAGDLNDFAEAIERRFGHGQENGRYHDLANLLEARLKALKMNYAAYRALLVHSEQEWTTLAPLLTVPETYFFRLPDQLEAFAGAVLPALLKSCERERTLRVLSAGCASGEEPYTLRILLNERFPQLAASESAWTIQIDAFDLSQPALERARAAEYTAWSLRATSEERRRANFTAAGSNGKLFHLRPAARAGVRFFCHNLLDRAEEDTPQYDVIFCRNVLIYLSPEAVDRAIARLTEQLAPGGYLFLGPAESLRGLTRNFVLCQTHEVFYYRRRDRITLPEPASPPAASAPSRKKPAHPASHLAGHPETRWFEEIQSSAQRLAQLMPATGSVRTRSPQRTRARPADGSIRSAPGLSAAGPNAAGPNAAGDAITQALALLRSGAFQDALAMLGEQAQPGQQLLRAAAFTHLGRYKDAERECTLLLAADDRNAGAHFLLGLCREQAGELPEAEEHMRQASYLDPSFALPQLHLGLLARRRQDGHAARKALERALTAFRMDDDTRIALFAGGLSRESLVQLCERELHRPVNAA